ncbi:MAG: hypothetical protein WCU74_00660 [Candidatus Omnitrophota bacterium]|jgi:hypothetical protein
MKKTLFALLTLVFVGSLFSVQGVAAPVSATKSTKTEKPAKKLTYTGKVDSLSMKSTVAGTNAQMTVRDGAGIGTIYYIANDVVLEGKEGKKTTLSYVQGNNVSGEYVMGPNGRARIAKTIKML